MHGCKKIILTTRQHIIVHGHTGCHEFGDAALHQFLGELRILELLAYGHPLSGTHKLRQIAVESVMRKSGQFNILGRTIGSAREGYAQYFRCFDSIVGEGFIEIADTEKQNCVGMFGFHLDVLLHQRRLNNLFRHQPIFFSRMGMAIEVTA